MLKIWHNPRCTKSRLTLQLLEEKNLQPEVIKYLETPPSEADIKDVLKKLAITPSELMRKGEAVYKELGLDSVSHSHDELIAIMHQNPILIERPVVIHNNQAAIGRPPENVLEILD